MNLSDNAKGISLAIFGIITLSPDSLLIRLINTDIWTTTFLRSVFVGVSLLVFMLVLYRGETLRQFKLMDRYALLTIVFIAGTNFFFVASIQSTSVAHTLIIVGAAPVVAAILGLVFIREKVTRQTWITIAVVIISLIFVVYDNQKSTLIGDLFALIVLLLWSSIFIFSRLTRSSNMLGAMCISGFISASWSYPLADLSNLDSNQIGLGLLLGCLVGAALSQITLAPRFIPVAEVAVFMPLETVFGSLLVWWILDEYPGIISILAGSTMVLAIMLSSYYQIKYSTTSSLKTRDIV
jgi:drug/metabolite transporter (DMT)-like permease